MSGGYASAEHGKGAKAGSAGGGASHGEEAVHGGGVEQKAALKFLTGKGPLSSAAMVGLHKGMLDRKQVHRVIAASKRGAKLGAGMETKGRTLKEIVGDSAFQWGDDGDKKEGEKGAPGGGAAGGEGGGGAAPKAGVVHRKDSGAAGVQPGAEGAVAKAPSSGGAPLPSAVQSKFEGALGADLGGVRVHTGEESATAAKSVGARAYTVGNDIHFGAGQYDPHSPQGQHLLAHEVAHSVQQSGGGAATAPQHKLEVSQPGDAHEVAADRAADAMVEGKAVSVGVGGGLARKIQREPNPQPGGASGGGTWHTGNIQFPGVGGSGLVDASDRANAYNNLFWIQLILKPMASIPGVQAALDNLSGKMGAFNQNDSTPLTPQEAQDLDRLGTGAVLVYIGGMQQMKAAAQEALAKANNPEGLDKMDGDAMDILHAAFRGDDESKLKDAKEISEKVHELGEDVHTGIDWAQKALKLAASSESWAKVQEALEGIGEIAEKALKLQEVMNSTASMLTELDAADDSSKTTAQQIASGMQAAVSAANAINTVAGMIGLKDVGGLGSVLSGIADGTKAAARMLNQISQIMEKTADQKFGDLMQQAVNEGGPAPRIDKITLAQNIFPGGQATLNYMWAAFQGDPPDEVPSDVNKLFYEQREKMNAGHDEGDQLQTDWHLQLGYDKPLVAHDVTNVKNWVKANKAEVWGMLYGSLPHPNGA